MSFYNISKHKINIDMSFIISKLSVFFFSLTVFSVFGQVYYSPFAAFITPSLLLFFSFSIKDIYMNIFSNKEYYKKIVIYLLLLVVMFIYSVAVQQNSIILVFRFFTVLVLLPLAFFIPSKSEYHKVLIFIAFAHSVVIVIFGLYLGFNQDLGFARWVRDYVRSNQIGDIYSYNGWFYRIQVKGNSLLPVALFVKSIVFRKGFLSTIFLFFIFFGVIFAGNLSFWISLIVYFVIFILLKSEYMYMFSNMFKFIFKSKKTMFLSFLFLVTLFLLIYSYFGQVILLKMETSIPLRLDQINVLFSNQSESIITIFFGKGLGNTVDVTTNLRSYVGAYYYELQTLYILNQVGILFFTYFVFLKYYLLKNLIQSKFLILIYLVYILYAITNPYIFDITNILVIISIISAKNQFMGGRNFDK